MQSVPATARRKRSAWEIQRAVWFALVVRELRTRMGRHWTGIAWMVFEPLLHLLLIVTMFGYLRHVSSPNMEFPVFLISGLMPFLLFRNLAQRLTESIDANRGLYSYRQVKPIDTVVARGIVECVMWFAVLVVSLTLLLWLGFDALPRRLLEFLAAAGLAALLGSGLGLLLAVATHRRPRIRTMLRMLYFLLYFGSGVIFSIDRLPESYQAWLRWNPLVHVVDLARDAFVPRHQLLAGVGWSYPAAVALPLLAFALALYRRDRHKLLLDR